MLPDLLAAYEPGPGRLLRGGMVLSADGGAAHGGTSRTLSTPTDRAVLRALRATCDLVLVGARTARAEAYGPVRLPAEHSAWRTARGRTPTPALAVVSRSLDLPAGLADAALVVTCAAAPSAGLPQVLVAGQDEVDLAAALDELADRGFARVLCEGGPALLGSLVAADLLDELCCTVSPHLLGRSPGLLDVALPAPLPLRLLHVLEQDGTLLLRWGVRTPGG